MVVENAFNDLMKEAVQKKVSDIYLLPQGDKYFIKMRWQNKIVLYKILTIIDGHKWLNYCKFKADMAISEHRRPQVGALNWYEGNHVYSLRLSTVGDFNAHETLVIRIIYPLTSMEKSLYLPAKTDRLRKLVAQRGLILFAGPTGSGKTTSIYQLAQEYTDTSLVMTIEDPVEILEPRFLQLQVNDKADMGYEELIKVGLRHRPDIFIIGEIRDPGTANAAIQSALSGHLVFSTVHAQSPLGIIKRLRQLGIEPDFITQAVTGLVYQRLIANSDKQLKALMVVNEPGELYGQNKYDWRDWQQNLTKLVEQGEIDEQNIEKYWWG
ncbi:type II secretion system protein E [Lentilactobacillus senioris DSM 24302 = JCM 17472]|uniref:Type II secretion system protein E n=1 Tax=Lentilactobacillus senioris DSM 24302 = JCM 17472 TaxID=1423802 RepID=A0A0R2CQ85_9LACO|nr:competence type IV pilus ATPase ComGA [Lentilactobacillus senioris]KRM93719.1 type II secretion system protein E [Lentilactobacillus senioris DSM 24302 = JCM 17472]